MSNGISTFGGKGFTIGLAMALANTANVFVVDDNASIRASIQELLKSSGLRSRDFDAAEKFLQRKPLDGPSCLILDVSLPGPNGIAFSSSLSRTGRERFTGMSGRSMNRANPLFSVLVANADVRKKSEVSKND